MRGVWTQRFFIHHTRLEEQTVGNQSFAPRDALRPPLETSKAEKAD